MQEVNIPLFIDEKSLSSSQYATTVQGIRNAATRSNFRIRLISEKQVDTIAFDALPLVSIVAGVNRPFMQKVISTLRTHRRNAVLAGTDSEQFGSDVSCATPSRRVETLRLIQYLYSSCGKEKIALVGFGRNSINDDIRAHTALSTVSAIEHRIQAEDLWQWTEDPLESFEAFVPHCKSYDAVICPNDSIAVCLVNFLSKQGIGVPEDLFVASFGNMAIGRYHVPSITSMTMDLIKIGEAAFQTWRFLMRNDCFQQSALKITVPSHLVIRESTAYHPQEAEETALPVFQNDSFYHIPSIAKAVAIENCITKRDDTDILIIRNVMDGKIYEQISGELFISGGTLRYRLNKIFADTGVESRQEFEQLIHDYLGEGNPFTLHDSPEEN